MSKWKIWSNEEIDKIKLMSRNPIEKEVLQNEFKDCSINTVIKKSKKIGFKIRIKWHHHKEWSKEEIKNLFINYLSDKDSLVQIFPNRDWKSIYRKIIELKLNRNEHKPWTHSEIEFLKNNYYNKSQKELSDEIKNHKWDQIKIKASKLGIVRSCEFLRNSSLKTLMDETPEAYYWMGFLLADGSFYNNRIKLTLHKKDIESVLGFSKFIKSNQVHIYNNYAEIQAKDIDVVPLICKKFGIKPRKTYNPPNLKFTNSDLFISLLAGYIDGDGSIRNQHKRKSFYIALKAHSSWINIYREFEKNVYDIFKIVRNRNSILSKINNQGYSSLVFSNTKICKLIKAKAIELNLPIMKRKWDIINMNYTTLI